MKEIPYKILNPEEAIVKMDEVIELSKKGSITHIYFDLETGFIDPDKRLPWHGEVLMFQFGHDLDEVSYSVPLKVSNQIHFFDYSYIDQFVKIAPVSDKERIMLIDKCKQMSSLCSWVGHNIKYDLNWACVHGLNSIDDSSVKDDTLILATIVFGRNHTTKLSLKNLCSNLFKVDSWDEPIDEYLSKFRLRKDKTYANVPTSVLAKYGAYDIYWTKRLYNYFLNIIHEEQYQLRQVLNKTTEVFSKVEIKGINIDKDIHFYLDYKINPVLNRLEEKIYNDPQVMKLKELKLKEAIEFNSNKRGKKQTLEYLQANSFTITPNNMKKVLFDKEYYGMSPVETTDNGTPSLNKKNIQIMIDKANEGSYKDLLVNMKERSALIKLKNTYIDTLDSYCVDGLYKPSFNLTGTVTGRLSSGLHTVPANSDLRRMFISRFHKNGGLILSPDFSQLELRILAAVSNELNWINRFKEGGDIHEETARTVFNKMRGQEITHRERKLAKGINFGIVYQEGVKSLASQLGVSLQEAKEFYSKFFKSTPSITSWIEKQKKIVKEKGSVMSPLGRYFPLPEGKSKDSKLVALAERRAVNYPIQGTASDVTMIVISEIANYLKESNMKSLVIGSVHDEILIDVYPGELMRIILKMEDIINNIHKDYECLSCPIAFDYAVSSSWLGIDMNIKEISENNILFEATSISKDYWIFLDTIQKGYTCKSEIIDEQDFNNDGLTTFIKDNKKFTYKMDISRT